MTTKPTVLRPWACPSCRVTVTTAFCPACGEHPLQPSDLTLRGLFDQVVQIFSNVDSRVVHSVHCLVMQPGALSLAFQNGQRKPYIGSFQLFILTNLLFFALQSFTGMKIFSNALDFRLNGQQWSEFGQMLVDQRLAATGRTFGQYAPVFDQAVAVNAKSLIGLMVPAFALVAPLVFWRGRRPFAVHIVFALHFYAFLLLLFCLPLTAMMIDGALGGDADDRTRMLQTD